jgi:hypothetical protein
LVKTLSCIQKYTIQISIIKVKRKLKKKKGCTEQLTSEVMEKIAEGILELDKNLLGYLCLRRNTP